MKVVGLLSGGKDSVFNLLHCVLNGHEPIALASLGPPPGRDELDSYMYQTVGHSGLHTIAEAMELPLVTGIIKGGAVEMGSEYGAREGMQGTQGDETEDLLDLLTKVKDQFPDVQGVSVGAILSNYQRIRVEHVCSRLGLTPIAYLWERDQRELLGEMVQAEMESVLVKVAGAGLKVQHLGKSLREMEPLLHRLNDQYQLHVCGEGGEYETFTLDCPLFSRRIVLDQATTLISNDDPFSTVAHLHLDSLSLAEKEGFALKESFEAKRSRIERLLSPPPLLDESSQSTMALAEGEYSQGLSDGCAEVEESLHELDDGVHLPPPQCSEQNGWLAFANIFSGSLPMSLEDEVLSCFASLADQLSRYSFSLLDVSHLTVYLSASSMSLFPAINAVYATHFGTSPPTRACVAVRHLPGDRRLMLEGWARVRETASEGRDALHVQSLSYWASANIGPYSQAVAAHDRLFVAGQIALIPACLQLPSPSSVSTETALSLQHLRRITIAAQSGRWRGTAEGGICWLSPGSIAGSEKAEWDRRLRAARTAAAQVSLGPLVYVEAASLPRGASIEWQITFRRNQEAIDSDDEEALAAASKTLDRTRSTVGIVAVKSASGAAADKVTTKPLLIRAFHRAHVTPSRVYSLAASIFGLPLPPMSVIVTRYLATSEDSDEVDVVFLYG